MQENFSWARLWGLFIKEFTQFRRDRSTFAMIISLPIVQLLLFGYAINTNPRHLPAALVNMDRGQFSRTLIHGLQNTEYFNFKFFPASEQAAEKEMMTHQVLFSLHIPPNFSRQLVRGEHPAALLEVDGTDPVSVAYAVAASNGLMNSVFQYDLNGIVKQAPTTAPAQLIVHTRYNPAGITQYNIVPGLLGTILTMTFVMVAAMALTREKERGTLETLLATPLRPLEVIMGKATPFVIVGYLQIFIILLIARWFFNVPLVGSSVLLLVLSLPFILANLAVGITVSTLARSQLEASQLSIFFFLPSMLLSGFAFPFRGMPIWAQWLANALPLTHFINIVRGIMLKGVTFTDTWVDVWPMLVFMGVMLAIALKRYRRTLD